jgi:hypothetical protein
MFDYVLEVIALKMQIIGTKINIKGLILHNRILRKRIRVQQDKKTDISV